MEQIKFISGELAKSNILHNYIDEIELMISNGMISNDTPPKLAYTTFLLNKSETDDVFAALLRGECPFDISFTVQSNTNADLNLKLNNAFGKLVSYIYTEQRGDTLFFGIKLSQSVYISYSANEFVNPYTIIGNLVDLPDSLFFYERPTKIHENRNVNESFSALIEHLKLLDLPLAIVDADLISAKTNPLPIFKAYIWLEPSREWPDDLEAVKCAKTAFYCQIHKQSKHSVFINRESVTLKYKELYFLVEIMHKPNNKYKIEMEIQKQIKDRGYTFQRNILMLKCLLAEIGVYPLYVDDLIIEAASFAIPSTIVGEALFARNFFELDIFKSGQAINISSGRIHRIKELANKNLVSIQNSEYFYNWVLPNKWVINCIAAHAKIIKEWHSPIFNIKGDILSLNLLSEAYDIIMSVEPFEGGTEIVGSLCTDFELGTPDYADFIAQDYFIHSDILYFPISQMLMANARPTISKNLLANLLILNSSFRFVRFNF